MKLHLTYNYLFFILCLLFSACAKDNFTSDDNQGERNPWLVEKPFTDFGDSEEFAFLRLEFESLLKKLHKGNSSSRVAKDSLGDLLDFTIDSSVVKKITIYGITSYTFPVVRDKKTKGILENLVCQVAEDNIPTFYLVRYYHYTNVRFTNEHKSYQINGEREVILLDDNLASLETLRLSYYCTPIYEIWCNWDNDPHAAGEQCEIEDTANGGDRLFVRVSWYCTSSGGGGYDPNSVSYPIGSASGGYDPIDENGPGPVTSPTFPDGTNAAGEFVTAVIGDLLTTEEKNWIEDDDNQVHADLVLSFFQSCGSTESCYDLAATAIKREFRNNGIALNVLLAIENNLAEENYSFEATQEFHLTKQILQENVPWRLADGFYKNISSLHYSAKRTFFLDSKGNINRGGRRIDQYLLDNGDIISQGDYPICSGCSETELTIFYYSQELLEHFKMPEPTSYSSLDLNFIFSGFWSGVAEAARLFTPLEEAIILIDGKDFDGVAQSKATAGLFILIDIVPGGKVLKITRKAGHALSAASPVVKIVVDATYKSQNAIRKHYRNIISTANDLRKGNWSEICTDLDFYEKGYEVVHVNRKVNIDFNGDNTGIDHIFRNPQTGEFVIVETKYHGSGGLSTLSDGTRQMSDAWISNNNLDNSNRLWKALDGNMDLYNQIKPNPNTLNYKRVVAYIQADGSINYKYVSSSGYEVNTFTN